MRYLKPLFCCGLAMALLAPEAQGQLLKKLKEKAEAAINNSQAPSGNNTNTGNTTTTGTDGRPSNRGGGLVVTPPNVPEHLTAAETSFKGSNYSEARYAIQQAMLGVELEIGQSILKSLPKTIGTLKADTTQDQVVSSGWGWSGLTIHREWQEGDKQFDFSIANNAAFMQAINAYFANPAYAQANGQQGVKQTRLKGYKAIIEYDEGSGYKLSVPLGQTSLLMFQGVNYANEQEFMKAAETIDIEKIKKSLGEN